MCRQCRAFGEFRIAFHDRRSIRYPLPASRRPVAGRLARVLPSTARPLPRGTAPASPSLVPPPVPVALTDPAPARPAQTCSPTSRFTSHHHSVKKRAVVAKKRGLPQSMRGIITQVDIRSPDQHSAGQGGRTPWRPEVSAAPPPTGKGSDNHGTDPSRRARRAQQAHRLS